MPVPSDLIHNQSTTTGTGDLTLVAVNGKRSFNTGFGTGGSNLFDYYISNQGAAEWERGTGHLSSSTVLVRDTVLASSNANALVNFSAGTKDVANDIPAANQARLDAANSWANTTDASSSATGSAQFAGGVGIGKKLYTGDSFFPAAGTTAIAPITFTGGTNLTTPVAGAMEYDGTCHYLTHAASERGAVNAEQWICNTATRTLASQTAAQAIFNSPANGAVTVAGSTMYQFECIFNLSSMSATSGGFGFAIGGTATLTSQMWFASARKVSNLSTSLSSGDDSLNTAANTLIASANTTTLGWAVIKGMLRVNAGGTIIPQVSLGIAAAAVVGINSFFRIWPVGTNTQVSLGNWS